MYYVILYLLWNVLYEVVWINDYYYLSLFTALRDRRSGQWHRRASAWVWNKMSEECPSLCTVLLIHQIGSRVHIPEDGPFPVSDCM